MATLPYAMFDLDSTAADARRLDRMENIYHRGQDLAWRGRETLDELVKKHGGVHVPDALKPALASVYGSIMWGELAAWKISAQLADRIEPLGAKMAATSQAHDEARHFYVMHDYLALAVGAAPKSMHPAGERLLLDVLEADDLACKLLGMQLQVETAALTIFQHTREKKFCPVLSDLLLYFEKDEARHVGLGMQYLPMLMAQMTRAQRVRFTAFALKVTYRLIASNRAIEPGMRALGLDPRVMIRLGKSKQTLVFEELWASAPGSRTKWGDAVSLVMQSAANALWPENDDASTFERMRAFVDGLRRDGVDSMATSIDPTEPDAPVSSRAAAARN